MGGGAISGHVHFQRVVFCPLLLRPARAAPSTWPSRLDEARLRTLSPPPSSAPCEASEVTTCVPSDALSDADVLGVTRRPSVACSAST